MRILIFDLQFAKYIYHSTPIPSAPAMLISSYHKVKGDTVVFTDCEPNFGIYDKVYIIKDQPGLFHLPKWISYGNVILIGRYWEGLKTEWKIEWEKYPPDNTLYTTWLENWVKKYPKYNAERLNTFFYIPIKIKQGNKITCPEGKEFLIIDWDWHKWDNQCEIMKNLNIDKLKFLYPVILDNRQEYVFPFLKQKNIVKNQFWASQKLITDITELEKSTDLWNEYKLGRMIRIKTFIKANSQKEWEELFPYIFKYLSIYREKCKKRIYIEPLNIESFSHPRILQELKRWTGKDMGYAKNSLFDYMLYDGCRDNNFIIDFLIDPYLYIQQKRQGTNKFKELVDFIEEKPELMKIISTPVRGSAG